MYRRHTNFAIEAIEQTFNGTPDFGRKVSCPIVRNGDLVTKMYLHVTLPALDVSGTTGALIAWGPRVGLTLIDSVELEIGGSQIDKHYGDWLSIWYELSHEAGQARGYANMVGDTPALTAMQPTIAAAELFIPLQFFHCRNDGLALPLIALQYHDVRYDFEFNTAANCLCYNTSCPSISSLNLSVSDATLLVNYIYLDSEERKRFAQASHEYLIEQLQFTGDESISSANNKYRLNFNHPNKELIWAVRFGRYTSSAAFLAWDPNNTANMVDLATRRFVQAMAAMYTASGTTSDLVVVSTTNAQVMGSASLFTSASLCALWAGINPQVVGLITGSVALTTQTGPSGVVCCTTVTGGIPISTTPRVVGATYNDITYVAALPLASVSTPTATLFAGVTRNSHTGLTAFMGSDVNVNDHHNHALSIDRTGNPCQTALLQLNGNDRFSVQSGNYFNYVQPWEAHTRTPADGINVYAFSLHPEEHQPSGSCNMSRIDNAQLNLVFGETANPAAFVADYLATSSVVSIYGTNYNVLRIMSGMGKFCPEKHSVMIIWINHEQKQLFVQQF